jgi:hypothetical protein
LSAILLIVFLLKKKKKRKQIEQRNVENKELNQSQSQSQHEIKSQSTSQLIQNLPETQYNQRVESQQSQNSERRESTIVLMKTLVPTKVCHFL